MKQPGIHATLLALNARERKRRGEMSSTAIISARNAFAPSGANYDVDADGRSIAGLSSPGSDLDVGDEVVVHRSGNQGEHKIIISQADLSRRPTQSRQSTLADVTDERCI